MNNNWIIRIGRQAVELDNKRLFSKANWNQWSRAHDRFNLVFKNKKVLSEAMVFFNQTATPTFGTDFSPTTFSNYKFLGLYYLKVKLSETLSLLTQLEHYSFRISLFSGVTIFRNLLFG